MDYVSDTPTEVNRDNSYISTDIATKAGDTAKVTAAPADPVLAHDKEAARRFLEVPDSE
jgi:hypothetical protein